MRTYPIKPLPGDPNDPVGLTALLQRYLIWMETHSFATGTVTIRRLQLSRFLLWCDQRSVTKGAEVTRDMIEHYQRHLYYYRKRDGQPLSLSSQSHWLISVRSWFAWMVRLRLLEHSPASDMVLPREEKRLPRHALTEREVENVLAQADISRPHGLRTRAILETLYSTGLRRLEVLSLHLTDLDWERGIVLVRNGKGRKDRFVPIGVRALTWLAKYQAEVRPRFLVDPRTPLLFLTSKGRMIHPNQLSALVRDYFERAGVAKRGACHIFRHTAATLMLEGGADIRYIQALLGHASLSTTQIYTHVSILKLREVHARTHPARLDREPGPSDQDPAAGDGPPKGGQAGDDGDDDSEDAPNRADA